ncbi:MAG: carboxypeptidase regulatory-like domain-containing protein [Planctomycetaceae bacterium]|nr:carboxypeptidase regulatory-like domain-containing protein [Planctomycetaceae bacterium]
MTFWRSLFVGFLVILAGCDGFTSVDGTVVDGDGNPVEGASIRVWRGDAQLGTDALSDSDGRFHQSGSHAPGSAPIDYVVSKSGFKSDRRKLKPNKEYWHMRIVLERIQPVADGPAQDR